MDPALPDPTSEDGRWVSADPDDNVGRFTQGSPFSRWALARYLVGRAIGESVSATLLVVALVLLVVAALCEWVLDTTVLAILVVIVAVVDLLLRWALRAVLRRLTAADVYGPVENRLRAMVSDTRGDVLRELRRLGLPSHTLTLPLLAVRLAGRRREDTVARLRTFEVERAVPKARLDELHMLLRDVAGAAPRGPSPPGKMRR